MRKNHEIRVRLTLEEQQTIQRKASRIGMTISSFLRTLGLLADIEPTNVRQTA